VSEQPAVGGRMPIQVEVAAGETYWWCACGRSKTQPFCDGSHAGTAFSPVEYLAERTRRLLLCTCKRTAKAPICDNSHLKL
jgi:CDGSH-type Zn-finger protein